MKKLYHRAVTLVCWAATIHGYPPAGGRRHVVPGHLTLHLARQATKRRGTFAHNWPTCERKAAGRGVYHPKRRAGHSPVALAALVAGAFAAFSCIAAISFLLKRRTGLRLSP
jgi:hypothetical protein